MTQSIMIDMEEWFLSSYPAGWECNLIKLIFWNGEIHMVYCPSPDRVAMLYNQYPNLVAVPGFIRVRWDKTEDTEGYRALKDEHPDLAAQFTKNYPEKPLDTKSVI